MVPPLVRYCLTISTLSASNYALRCIGRTPSCPTDHFQASRSGRYLGAFFCCLTPTGSSLEEKTVAYFSLQHVSYRKYPSKIRDVCQVLSLYLFVQQHFLSTFQSGFSNICATHNASQFLLSTIPTQWRDSCICTPIPLFFCNQKMGGC